MDEQTTQGIQGIQDFLSNNITWIMAGVGVLGLGIWLISRRKTTTGQGQTTSTGSCLPMPYGATLAQQSFLNAMMNLKNQLLQLQASGQGSSPQAQAINAQLLQLKQTVDPSIGRLVTVTDAQTGQWITQLVLVDSIAV